MPLKARGPPARFEAVDRWAGGVGWIAHPEETMERASHALFTDDGVWIVDPVDAPDVDLLTEGGDVAGVVVTMDRHTRDAAAVASRHGVRVHAPTWVGKALDVDAPLTLFDDELGNTQYRALRVVDLPGWHEGALFDRAGGTLVVGDAVGTASYFLTADERLGVHPMLRIRPPGVLRGLDPERILVGHGRGIFDGAPAALRDALDGARKRIPSLLVQNIGSLFRRGP